MNARMLAISLYLTAVIIGACDASVAEPLRYEPATVQLSGKIVIEIHYGPPNFGETPATDKKEKVRVLELDSPISVTADSRGSANTDSFGNVRRVQLLDSQTSKLVNVVGRHVTVLGTLFEDQGGENYTDVVMNVQKVLPAK